MAEDRALLRECRNLAYQLKTALVVLEGGHSNLWEMADVIYRDLAGRARERPPVCCARCNQDIPAAIYEEHWMSCDGSINV